MIYAFFGVFLVGMLLGGGVAHRVTADSYEADMGKAARKEKVIFDANNERIDKLSNELEVAKAMKNIEYKEIVKYVTKTVEKPIYQLECIDDDGLRAINSVIADRPLDTSEPSAALREGDTSGGKDGEGADAEADRAVEAPQ